MEDITPEYPSKLKMILNHSMVKDAGFLTLSEFVSAVLGFITTVFAARILGSSGYGQVALILAYPSLLLSLGSFKSISVIIRYLAQFNETNKAEELKAICKLGYGIDFLAFFLIFLLVGVTSGWVGNNIYNLPKLSWLMVLYAASFPFLSLKGTSYAVLTSLQEFRLLAALTVFDKGATLIVVFILLNCGFGVTGMVLGMAVGHVIVGVFALSTVTYLFHKNGIGIWWKASFNTIASLRKELFSFFGWNYLVVTLNGIIIQAPLMFLGKYRGPEEAGFYRLALSLMTVCTYPENALRRVVYPRLSAQWVSGEKNSTRLILKRWTLFFGLPLSLAMLLLIPLLPYLVPLIFGEVYRSLVLCAQVLIVGASVSAIFFWLNPYYYSTGRLAVWTGGYSLYALLVVVMGWICIQWWGYIGMAGLLSTGKIFFVILMVAVAIGWRIGTSRKMGMPNVSSIQKDCSKES